MRYGDLKTQRWGKGETRKIGDEFHSYTPKLIAYSTV